MSRGKPGDIVRQALFMILASSGSPGLGERYPVLRDIVLRKAPASLPAEMTLRLSLVITPRARMIPPTGEANLDRNAERALVEVAYSPLGWLLEVRDPSDRTSANVSSWTPGVEQDVSLATSVGTITTALPADYRWRSEIPGGEDAQAPGHGHLT